MPQLSQHMGMEIHLDPSSLAKFQGLFKQLGINIARPTRFLRLCGVVVRKETQRSFLTETSPSGRPWAPMADSTKAARRRSKKRRRAALSAVRAKSSAKRAGTRAKRQAAATRRQGATKRERLLRDEGTMYRSIRTRVAPALLAVVVGFSDEKAPWHQRPRKDERARPARPKGAWIRKFLPERWNQRMYAQTRAALVEQVRRKTGRRFWRGG